MSERCKARFKKAAGTEFTDAEIDDYVRRIQRRRAAQMQTDMLGDPLDTPAAIRDILDGMTREEVAEFARRTRLKAYDKIAKARLKVTWSAIQAPDDMTRLKTFLVGVGHDDAGAHRGLDQISRAAGNRRKTDIVQQLKDADLWHHLKEPLLGRADSQLDADLFIEISRFNGGPDAPTGNKTAADIAKILAPHLEDVRLGLNAQGAEIGKIDGYVVPQHHDALRVAGGFLGGRGEAGRKKSMQAWKDFIRPLLHPKTFEDVDDIDGFLDKIWANIITGNHETIKGTSLDSALADIAPPQGQAALANRLGRSRVLHFKDAASAVEYRRKFSGGTTIDAVFRHIERAAKQETLLKYLGPNPDATFETLLKHAADQLPAHNQPAGKAKSHFRQAEYDELTGAANAVVNIRANAFVTSLKALQVVSKLGGMVISSVSDVPLAANTLMRGGVSLGDAYGEAVKGIFRIGDTATRREVAETLGVAINVMTGSNVSRYALSDGAGGLINRAQQKFYKLNLFETYQTGLRQGVGYVYARHLGRMAEQAFGGLNARTQATLRSYGIDAGLWDAVRGEIAPLAGSDSPQAVLTPDAAKTAPDALVSMWARANGFADVSAARAEMGLRLDMLFMDMADRALTEPKAGEKALLRFGAKGKGTALRSLIELMMQFKSFPATVLTQHVIPSVREARKPGNLEARAQTAHLIMATWVAGYMAMQAKQALNGKTPLPNTSATAMAALIQGGGWGIFGDFLFADYSRYGNDIWSTVAGPSMGTINQFAKTVQSLFTVDKDDQRGGNFDDNLFKLAKDNLPFGNLFYSKAALNYLILYNIQETLKPGSLRRMESRLESDRGQQYFIPPSHFIPEGGANPSEYLPRLADEVGG